QRRSPRRRSPRLTRPTTTAQDRPAPPSSTVSLPTSPRRPAPRAGCWWPIRRARTLVITTRWVDTNRPKAREAEAATIMVLRRWAAAEARAAATTTGTLAVALTAAITAAAAVPLAPAAGGPDTADPRRAPGRATMTPAPASALARAGPS